MKRVFLFAQIFFCCFLCWNHTAFAYNDSTSFDPTEASIKPKAIGGVPVGTIVAWPVSKNPEDMENWLECNGQTISQTVYPELFAVIGSRVPDYRGLFLRGLGSQAHAQNNGSIVGVTSTTHSSAALGQVQGDATRNIYGGFALSDTFTNNTWWVWDGFHSLVEHVHKYRTKLEDRPDYENNKFQNIYFNSSRIVPTASENRPVNTSVRYFVRSKP